MSSFHHDALLKSTKKARKLSLERHRDDKRYRNRRGLALRRRHGCDSVSYADCVCRCGAGRVDSNGNVTEVGMLLRVAPDGNISRTFISGRVLYGEKCEMRSYGTVKRPRPSHFPGSPCHRLRSPLLSISLTRISAAFTTHANTMSLTLAS